MDRHRVCTCHPAKFSPDGTGFQQIARTPSLILTQNASKDAVTRKEKPFLGRRIRIWHLDSFPHKLQFILCQILMGRKIFL